MWKCSSNDCGKTFHYVGRLTKRTKPQDFIAAEEIFEVACCPHCKSLDFEEVKEETTGE